MTRVAMIVWNEFLNDARVLKEAQTLRQNGYDVCVYALHTPGVTKKNEFLTDGIQVYRVARSPLWKWRKKNFSASTTPSPKQAIIGKINIKHQIFRIIARAWTHFSFLIHLIRHRAKVVHAHDVNTLPTAWLAARLSGAKLIYDAHEISTSREGYESFRKIVAIVEKTIMPKANGSITTTDSRAKFFARAYSISRPIVLQNRPRLINSTASNLIRDELDLSEEWPIILYQGGLQQGRGLEKLLRSAQYVPNAYFVFIGGGRLTQSLFELRSELELHDRVHFIPTVSLAELPSYTASADIGVQPIENTCLNHFTTDSNKLFEYLIAGLPVVATNFPEIRKIVQEKNVGILVPPDDLSALAQAINTLVSDADLRKQYATNAHKASATMNWEEQELRLVNLYKQVIAK